MQPGTQMGFRFVEQTEFDEMLRERTLTPGFWYFIIGGNQFHIAFTRDTYGTYSGVDVRELVDELLKHIDFNPDYLYQMITNQLLNSPNVIRSIADHLGSNNAAIQQIAHFILQDESVMQSINQQLQEILNQIVKSVTATTLVQCVNRLVINR